MSQVEYREFLEKISKNCSATQISEILSQNPHLVEAELNKNDALIVTAINENAEIFKVILEIYVNQGAINKITESARQTILDSDNNAIKDLLRRALSARASPQEVANYNYQQLLNHIKQRKFKIAKSKLEDPNFLVNLENDHAKRLIQEIIRPSVELTKKNEKAQLLLASRGLNHFHLINTILKSANHPPLTLAQGGITANTASQKPINLAEVEQQAIANLQIDSRNTKPYEKPSFLTIRTQHFSKSSSNQTTGSSTTSAAPTSPPNNGSRPKQ